MNTKPELTTGDIVITNEKYIKKSVIGIISYTNGSSVYMNGKEFDRKDVERLNPKIRYNERVYQHYHDSRNYWHPMPRIHQEENESPCLDGHFVVGDWVITESHRGVKIHAGKITEVFEHYVKINHNELVPIEYLIRVNPNVRFHEGEYEHRHNDINWHGMSRIHKEHAFKIGDHVISNQKCLKKHMGKPDHGIITGISFGRIKYEYPNGDIICTESDLIDLVDENNFRTVFSELEHRHDTDWHLVSKIHHDCEHNIEIVFKMVVIKGEPFYKLVFFNGIKSEEELPERYVNCDPTKAHVFTPRAGTGFFASEYGNIKVGDVTTKTYVDRIEKCVTEAAEHLREVNDEIKALEKVHCGEYIITA